MESLSLPANHNTQTKPRSVGGNTTTNLKSFRSVVLGKDGVGKSAFTVRLLTKRFIGEYDRTLEETYRHRVEVDGQKILLEILDTAGQNSVEKIDACSSADVFFVLYSTTDRSSFKEAALIIRYLLETRNVAQSAIFLIATKKDLKYEQDVTEYEGRLLAMDLGCEFYIISSSEGFDGTQDVLRGSLRFTLNNKNGSGSRSPLMTRVKKGLKQHRSQSHGTNQPQVIESRERTSTL
ncbi:ras-related and estrogen-regulated growth inhibitor-like [Orbicella faveolata]|uniref:ras-related and estrogen-regulated growth inhibitor-like n=1 Tax=Orbicella faveolata TaxID=48498 RepID=UPI0009E5AFEB|nr:ras-related and estrogen-regulated growth inhibitor-like [Orbicella faveolata]